MGLVEEAGRDDVVAIRKRPSVLAYAVLVGFGVGLTVLVVSMVAGGDKPDHVAKPTVPSTSTSTTTRATRSTVTSVVSTPVTVTAADGTTVAVTNPELDGAEPVGAVNLRLLTGGWILDVDSGSRTFLAGLPGDDYEVSEILPAGRDALMVYRHTCGPAAACAGAETRVFVLPWNEISAQPIYDGPGVEVAPGIDRFWITEQHADDDCTLSAVDGVTSSARPLRCSLHIVEETPIGLWASDGEPPSDRPGSFTDDVLLDPDSGDELFRTPQIVAVSDGWVVSTDESRRSYSLVDPGAADTLPLPTPSAIGVPDIERVSPEGRFVAISYYHPDSSDLWVLDLEERTWQHVPGFPVRITRLLADFGWSRDGRLVMVTVPAPGPGPVPRNQTVAVWRPGDPQLTLRRIHEAIDVMLVR